MAKGNKNPWLAGVLNIILPGLGYVYAGKRTTFGIGFVLVSLLLYGEASNLSSTELFGGLIGAFLFAYDGYKTAQEVNQGK